MGRGYLKQKNKLKKQNLIQAVKYIEQLEKENQALKNDPNSVVGQFISQYREMYAQNSRLSLLAAVLLKLQGGKVPITVEEMDSFKGNRINISWDLPEGVEKQEDAKHFIFSYDLVPESPAPQAQEAAVPAEPLTCTDPTCTLPKDLQHTHTTVPVQPTENPTEVSESLPAATTPITEVVESVERTM